MMFPRILLAPLLLVLAGFNAVANDALLESFDREFGKQIEPLIKKYCVSCHGAETAEAELDLSRFRQLQDVTSEHRLWLTILQRVEAE